jgi:low affinity Fe/Cu permease
MPNGKEKNWLERVGCEISARTSDISAHPFAQVGVVIICGLWFALGLATDVLTAILSILAISLSQMVLNRQNEREMEAHRRDVAMHAKLDELVLANRRARDEVAGIEEELDEEQIEELRHHAREAIEAVDDAPASPEAREKAREAVTAATEEVVRRQSDETSPETQDAKP